MIYINIQNSSSFICFLCLNSSPQREYFSAFTLSESNKYINIFGLPHPFFSLYDRVRHNHPISLPKPYQTHSFIDYLLKADNEERKAN